VNIRGGGSLGSDSFSGKVQEPIRLLEHKSIRQGHGGGVIKKSKREGRHQSKTGKMKNEDGRAVTSLPAGGKGYMRGG
jgi:hypothetical protein